MTSDSAQHYRERNSGEILEEQRELQRLKRITLLENGAWWEWNAETHSFNVSGEWERLTGYRADQVFPMNINPSVGIESMLERLCAKWLSFVAESDKPEAKEKIENFLLFNNDDNSFEHGYRLRLSDGSYRLVLTTARSVWEDGRLIELFAQTRDIEKWYGSNGSVVAIAKNAEAVKHTQIQLTELIEKTSGVIPYLKTQAPGFIAFCLSMFALIATNIIPFRRELYKIRQNWQTPLTIDESMTRTAESLFFEKLDDSTVQQVGVLLSEYSFYGESIRLAAYDNMSKPNQVQYLLQASKDPRDSASQFSQHVSSSPSISRRAQDHQSGQPNLTDDGLISKYSVAFTVVTDDLSTQLFFVEIMNGGATVSAKDKIAIEAACKELAARMKKLLDESSAL